MRNTRLSGHGLNSEGAAYERGGYTGNAWVPARSWTGVALCECGETSPVLESNGARKRWHAQHKDAVRGAFDGAPGHG
jgi:hypothetical protein